MEGAITSEGLLSIGAGKNLQMMNLMSLGVGNARENMTLHKKRYKVSIVLKVITFRALGIVFVSV